MCGSDAREGAEFISAGAPRILEVMEGIGSGFYREAFISERQAWNCFYDILDSAESFMKKGDDEMAAISLRAGEIAAGCEIIPGKW
jgi:hypothetical protein